MRSLLITGASGLLGSHLCCQRPAGWQLWGTYHANAIVHPQCTLLPLDLTDVRTIETVWQQTRPDAVIHTAALSKVGQCQQHPDLSHQINVTGTLALAQHCAQAQIPFIFTSTDLVFAGNEPVYSELDAPNPINVYGQHKALAEAQIIDCYPAATICRLPLMVGAATPTAQSFVQPLLQAIAAGLPQTLFTDEIRTPAAVSDVAQGLYLALNQGLTGIWHLGGRQRLNRYELGMLIAESFGMATDRLKPGLQSAAQLATPRPKDVSLDSQKAFAVGYAPQPLPTALAAIAASSRA